MKREHVLVFFTGTALSFALSLAAVGCLVTGFRLETEHMTALVVVLGFFSLICSACYSLKGGALVLLGLLALGFGYLWHEGTPWEQLLALIQRLSQVYDSAYGWGKLQLTLEIGGVDYPLGVLGALVSLAVSRAVCRGKGSWLAILTAVLPLMLCLVVTDTVPAEGYLLTLMAGVLILLLTAEVRKESIFQGSRLAAQIALPVVLALGLLFLAVPREGYVNRSKEIQQKILSMVLNVPYTVEESNGKVTVTVQGEAQEDINLKTTGARILQTYPVMDVTSGQNGPLYLRGQDYDTYSGTGWTSTAGRTERFALENGEADTVTIRTRGTKSILYLPYYPAGETTLTDGILENADTLKEYTFHCTVLPGNWRDIARNRQADYPAETRDYLDLPDSTRIWAEALLPSILPAAGSDTEKAEAIAAYVRGSAVYDLATNRMPSGEEDFAFWFLEESETGYCVHFATATVVLLRAAGIPARYVSGYMVDAAAGETVTVIAGNAHAWAEYYEPGLGTWVVLESTPAIPGEEETAVSTAETDTIPDTKSATETGPAFQTEPSTSGAAPTEPAAAPEPVLDFSWLAGLAKGLALTALLLGAMALQRTVRLLLRRTNQHRGTSNAQALARWREITLLAKLLKEEPPEDLRMLAQKAKYSQHAITQEELQCLDTHQRTSRQHLKEKPWYLRLVYRYIFAAY